MRKKGSAQNDSEYNPDFEYYNKKAPDEKRKEKTLNSLMVFFSILSIAGFSFTLYILSGATGAIIGSERENIYGLIVFLGVLLMLCITMFIKNIGKIKKKKGINIKELIEDAKID